MHILCLEQGDWMKPCEYPAPLGGKGLAELQTEIAAADETAVPAAAKQAIALLGREAERIELRRRSIDNNLMHQHKANPVSRRLAAIPGIGPIAALNLALLVDPAQCTNRAVHTPSYALRAPDHHVVRIVGLLLPGEPQNPIVASLFVRFRR